MLFARTSYFINWKAFPSKLVNQEANLLLLLLGTDLKIHLLNYSSRDFESFVGKLDAEGKEYYIIDYLNCNMLPSSLNNVNTQALLNKTDVYNLKQLVKEPTRATPVSSALIDVIFTSHPDNVSCSGVSPVGISDHSLIYAFRKISLPSAVKGSNTVSYRQFRNRFRSDILAQPWTDLMGIDNPNEMWFKWKSLFLEVCDVHAPFRTHLCLKKPMDYLSA